MLQNYQHIEGITPPQWCFPSGGGLVVDWNMKSSLDGLYTAGDQTFSAGDHSYAAATGRYAGRKAVDSIREIGDLKISREQIEREKARVYTPIRQEKGIEWKELHAGIARAMQFFCSEFKRVTEFDITT